MPTTTEHLKLEKPLGSENYSIAVFNANADKLDAAVKGLNTGKATGNPATGAARNSEKLGSFASTDFPRWIGTRTPTSTGVDTVGAYIKSLIDGGLKSAIMLAIDFSDIPTKGILTYTSSPDTNTVMVMLQSITNEKIYHATIRRDTGVVMADFAEVAVPRMKNWTPYLKGATTDPTVAYSALLGKYVKMGPHVTAIFQMNVTSVSGGSGLACLGGIPFTPLTASPLSVTYNADGVTGVTVTQANAFWNGSICIFTYGGSNQRLNISNMKTPFTAVGSMTYLTNQ